MCRFSYLESKYTENKQQWSFDSSTRVSGVNKPEMYYFLAVLYKQKCKM